MSIPPNKQRWLRRIFAPLMSQQPAAKLIRQTARQQWRLIALNLGCSLLEAVSEGATLAVVFMAVEVLSAPAGEPVGGVVSPLLAGLPMMPSWLNGMPPTALFMCLLALAVLLQIIQSLTRFLQQLSVAYFSARCRALVMAKIHSQVLGFSFPCASRYKVGDLTDYAGQGPEAIRTQIEQTSALLVGVLLSLTYLFVLARISLWLLLAVAVMAGLIIQVQKHMLPRIRSGSKAVTASQVAISSRIIEDFQGLRLLHSSGQLDAADQRLRAGMGELEHQLRAQGRRMAVIGPFSSLLPILAISILAGLSLLLGRE